MEIRRRLKGELSIFGGTFRKARQDSANDLAAAIAFWASFSIFPLLIGMLSVSSHFLESASLQSSIYEAVTESLPGSSELVKENLDAVVRYRGTMSLVAILGLFWTAGKVFGAITRAVNRALTVQRDRRPLVSKLRYFGMAIVVSILILVSLGITVVLEVALEAPALSKLGLDAGLASGFRSWATSFLLVFLVFTLIYKLTPYRRVTWHKVLPGALLAAVFFELGKNGFVLYLERVADLKAVYGSLSSIIVLLLWLYVSAMILILGAEYNIVRWQARSGSSSHGQARRALET
jgi:membrane protein